MNNIIAKNLLGNKVCQNCQYSGPYYIDNSVKCRRSSENYDVKTPEENTCSFWKEDTMDFELSTKTIRVKPRKLKIKWTKCGEDLLDKYYKE